MLFTSKTLLMLERRTSEAPVDGTDGNSTLENFLTSYKSGKVEAPEGFVPERA